MNRVVQTTAEDYRIAWLTALAITIHILESALPSPLPGFKPGLANVIVIVVLVSYGWRAAAWVSLLRVLVGSLLAGTFLSPTFLLSLSGALASVLILALASALSRWLPRWGAGPLGYSVLAAMAHMAGQFAVAYAVFIPHAALLNLLPILMCAALIFGMLSGMIAAAMISRITTRS
ncbi:MAG: heptaprenyl diphosphate synthase [Gammaproteobacteria bacterium RBG_16_57_12]|nr:MAG: heptaprenyl diphosphate synthase [Gammaproteobacteria bacterium RBG_16_57_12]